MSRISSIIDAAKNHPIVTLGGVILLLVGASAAFTQNIVKIVSNSGCLYSTFGLGGPVEGSAELVYSIRKHDWIYLGPVQKEIYTLDLHSRDSSRRTSYSIELSANDFRLPQVGDRKLDNPEVKCISGPCDWSRSHGATLQDEANTAKATFDVWGAPMTWVLSADVYEYQVRDIDPTTKVVEISSKKKVSVEIPVEAVNVYASITMKNGRTEIFDLDTAVVDKRLVSVSYLKKGSMNVYTIAAKDLRCG